MELYALIGKPLSHSFSQKYFRDKFRRDEISADYLLCSLERIEDLDTWISSLPLLKGFNITMPYKEQILPYLNDLDLSAKHCANCNCVKMIRHNNTTTLKGYNTDYYGLRLVLEKEFPISAIRKVAVLGSGGAAKTAKAVLKDLQKQYKIVSRNPKQEQGEISYEAFNSEIKDFQLIINATPIGMHPYQNATPNVDFEQLNPQHFVLDLIYNPAATLFLQKAQAKGCNTSNGYTMLCAQAEKAWEIWQNE